MMNKSKAPVAIASNSTVRPIDLGLTAVANDDETRSFEVWACMGTNEATELGIAYRNLSRSR